MSIWILYTGPAILCVRNMPAMIRKTMIDEVVHEDGRKNRQKALRGRPLLRAGSRKDEEGPRGECHEPADNDDEQDCNHPVLEHGIDDLDSPAMHARLRYPS